MRRSQAGAGGGIGTTDGINLVASAWACPRLRPEDEVLLTVAEHASNLLPWRRVVIGDCLTILVGVAALVALFRWKVSTPLLIAVTALVGLIAFPLLHPAWPMLRCAHGAVRWLHARQQSSLTGGYSSACLQLA